MDKPTDKQQSAAPFATHEVFNQAPPFVDINLFDSDAPLVEAVRREGGEASVGSLSAFGALIGTSDVIEEGRIANTRTPLLHSFDPRGERRDTVEFHPAYHAFMARSFAQGLHCSTWDHLADDSAPRPGRYVERMAGIYLMSQVEPGHVCPIVMTHACVAPMLAEPGLTRPWLAKVLSRDYDPAFRPMGEKAAVTVGMGMTEKQGGTDVRANTSQAVAVGKEGRGEEYLLTGHKWFLSAPMCDAFLMLAQTKKGLSCFLVPRFLPDGSVNALHFQRLKDKLGNRSNASSEVEFAGAHGWMVGAEGRGVATIIEMVTLTRLDCAISSAGLMRWGLVNALHHVRHRSVFQKRLIDQPMMASVLADMALDVEAATALAMRLGRAFDQADSDADEAACARLMTPVAKFYNCKSVPGLVYEAMECLGGNGYVEEGPMARLYREAPLNAIWEGSGNVMCLDVLRVLARDMDATVTVLGRLGEAGREDKPVKRALARATEILRDPARAEAEARFAIEQLALASAAALLRASAPDHVADAFIVSRLDGGFRQTYGTFGGNGRDVRARDILARALPEG